MYMYWHVAHNRNHSGSSHSWPQRGLALHRLLYAHMSEERADHCLYGGSRKSKTSFEYSSKSTSGFVQLAATYSPAEDRKKFAVDAGGALVFPATVRAMRTDKTLELEYDHGGSGLELPEHVRPRVVTGSPRG